MKHIVVDLEMNNVKRKDPVKARCRMEIIEIGAVMLDDDLNVISEFRTYVKPMHNDGITSNITELTGITTAMVNKAPEFNEAFRMFTKWCLGTGDEVTIYAWSDSDYTQIVKEMEIKNYIPAEEELVITDIEWSDFQKEFDSGMGFERSLSLENALNMAGIEFAGRKHTALDDAKNTAMLLNVFRNEDLFNETLRKIKEYMTPTECTNSLGDLFDFSILAV